LVNGPPYKNTAEQKCLLYVLQIRLFLKIPSNPFKKAKFIEHL
jgi:hypothetical protein